VLVSSVPLSLTTVSGCQCRLNAPQKCRLKIPQFVTGQSRPYPRGGSMSARSVRGQPKIIESIPTRYWSRSSALQPVV